MILYNSQILLSILCLGASVTFGVLGLGRLFGAGNVDLRRRLESFQRSPDGVDVGYLPRALGFVSRLPGLDRTARLVRRDLDAAGMGSPVYLQRFLGAQVIIAISGSVAALLLAFDPVTGLARPITVAYALTGLTLGFYAPRIWLDLRARRRLGAIELTLPDVLDLLVICFEAGMGRDAALARVAAEVEGSAPELSQELSRLDQEIRTGRPRSSALRALGRRVSVPDLESVVGVMLQSDRMGTPVGGPLRGQAQLLRTRRRQRAERRAREATVKLIIPLVFCIFPVILILLLGPAVYELMQAFGAAGGSGTLGG